MKESTRCFIKNERGQYEEISYIEFLRRTAEQPEGQKRWLIPVHGMLMEVTEQQYREFYRQLRRQKYMREEAAKAGVISYQQLEELAGYDCIVDCTINVEQAVVDKVTLQLRLKLLEKQELDLLRDVYYYEEKEREIAQRLGITQQAVHKRLKKILHKLRNN